MQGFLQTPQPEKALVLSFHGWSGTGKNFVARMVASHLYRDGLKSECVRLFISLFHFPHHMYVDSYKVRTNNTVLLWDGPVYWVCLGWSSFSSQQPIMELCFGFMSYVDNTPVSSACTASKPSPPNLAPTVSWLGVHKELGGVMPDG